MRAKKQKKCRILQKAFTSSFPGERKSKKAKKSPFAYFPALPQVRRAVRACLSKVQVFFNLIVTPRAEEKQTLQSVSPSAPTCFGVINEVAPPPALRHLRLPLHFIRVNRARQNTSWECKRFFDSHKTASSCGRVGVAAERPFSSLVVSSRSRLFCLEQH